MDKSMQDIAHGTFIGNWPMWLRWALFLPTSFVGSALASVLYMLGNALSGFFLGVNLTDGFYFQLISSAVLGGVFVYAGAWMAPQYQFMVSLFLLILLALISTILFLFSFSPESSMGPLLSATHLLALLITGGAIVFYLKNEV